MTTKLDRTDLRIVVRDLQDYERFLKRELAVIDAIGTIDFTIVLNRVPGEDSGGTGGAWVASGARTRQLILA